MVKFRLLNQSSANMPKKKKSGQATVDVNGFEEGHSGESTDTELTDEKHRVLYERSSEYLSDVFAAIRRKEKFSPVPGFELMRSMVDIQPFRDILFVMAIHMDDTYNFMINHSVNVAIFSMKMGAGLGFDKERQVEIATAALFHDVGTALIPDDIINKSERLSEKEFKIFRDRPKHSYQILRDLGESPAFLAETAVQVYEKLDGSGYPHGLKGEEIHEYAQIIGLVDMYEALIHSRPQREKLLHFSAVKEIIKTSKSSFQRKHLKTLLSIFSIFPIYSFVRLNSEAIGKVIETYPDQPMRPRLQIVYDSQKRRVLAERIINLPENPLLYITDSVSEEDLEQMAE